MNLKENFIKKDTTNLIKGVCIILMFIHHLFALPHMYISDISYPNLQGILHYLDSPLKIGIGIFAFLTGYFYYLGGKTTYKYSIKKGTDIWLTYFFTFILMLIPALWLNVYHVPFKRFIYESFALSNYIMIFGWYVAFYILTMLILPSYSKLSKKSEIFMFIITIIAPKIILYELDIFFPTDLNMLKQVVGYLEWFPCVATGYIFAKYKLFDQFSNLLQTKNRLLNILIGLLLVITSVLARYLSQNYDFVYAPLFIYGICVIYNNVNFKSIFLPINIIGKYSLLMWFVHGIFFNVCKEYTQHFLYLPQNPILVIIWGLIVSLAISMIIKIPIDLLIKYKNKFFKL